MKSLTHLDENGRPRMVNVSDKAVTRRTATAEGRLLCSEQTLALVRQGRTPKGAVIHTAELAGIMAAKRTHELIPLCHSLALSGVSVTIELRDELPGFLVQSEVRSTGQTGVEMEALTAVSIACLTLFDMLKAIDRAMVIDQVAVVSKTGGCSGAWAGTTHD